MTGYSMSGFRQEQRARSEVQAAPVRKMTVSLPASLGILVGFGSGLSRTCCGAFGPLAPEHQKEIQSRTGRTRVERKANKRTSFASDIRPLSESDHSAPSRCSKPGTGPTKGVRSVGSHFRDRISIISDHFPDTYDLGQTTCARVAVQARSGNVWF